MVIVKAFLKNVLGKTYWTYLKLYKTLTEVQSVMNFHRLIILNKDQFSESLTPNYLILKKAHLVYGRSFYNRCYDSVSKM